MRLKKNILNLFPKPVNLTEISILSIYELGMYIIIFICLWNLYLSWTKIPIKTIDIECERIDTLNFQDFPYANLKDLFAFNEDSSANIICNVNLNFSLSRFQELSRTPGFHLFSGYQMVNDSSIIRLPNHYKEAMALKADHHIDSLRKVYYRTHDSLQLFQRTNHPVYYQKIVTSYDAIRFNNFSYTHEWQIDTNIFDLTKSLSIKNYSTFKDEGVLKTSYEIYGIDDNTANGKEKMGVFDKPFIFDLFDISQFYIIFNLKSQNINRIALNLNFDGANEFIYVKETPDFVSAQHLEYKYDLFKNGYSNIKAKDQIILHVKSKELENLQNSRIFAITAVLSGLVVIFLTFFVIFLYRLFSGSKERSKLKKDKKNLIKSSSDEEKDKSSTKKTRTIVEKEEKPKQEHNAVSQVNNQEKI